MKTIFRSAKKIIDSQLAPITARPALSVSLELVAAMLLYAAGVWVVYEISGGARLPVTLVAMYFLPVPLRAWLQVYRHLRYEVHKAARSRRRLNKAL